MRKITLFLCLLCLFFFGNIPVLAQSNYIVATHYPAFGGTDPAPRDALQVSYGVYNNRENDYEAVDEARATEIIEKIERTALVEVTMLNDWAEVVEDSAQVQIVNNVPIEGALYTLVLPVGWNKSKKLPVVLSGNGAGISNNRRLYDDGEIDMPVLVGFSTLLGRSGFIGAMSNCGGTESQGIDETTYRSVGGFFDFIDQNGGDKTNVMTAGWSRGGGSALMWAINPLNLDYNVKFVFAGVPPTHYGTLSQVSVLTYPSMASIGTRVAHDENAWNYANDGLRPGMNPSPFMEYIIGTGNPAEADALSPIGLAEGLIGKQVLIEFGSHDAFFPLAPFLAFDRRLTELGVHHATVVTFNSGHEDGSFARAELVNALTAMVSGTDYEMPTGRFYFIDQNPLEDDEIPLVDFYTLMGIEDDPAELPVTVRFPYRGSVDTPMDIEICGTPGDSVDLSIENADYVFSVTLDETECATETIQLDYAPGVWTWKLAVNGELIPYPGVVGLTPEGCVSEPITILEAVQPTPETTYFSQRSMGFGMLEYVLLAPAVCVVDGD